jgi:hypothetical protein
MHKTRYFWLKSLLLDCIDSNLRKESCSWLYRIAILSHQNRDDRPIDDDDDGNLLFLLLNDLLGLLDVSIDLKIFDLKTDFKLSSTLDTSDDNIDDQSVSVSCKDYFFLLVSLMNNLGQDDFAKLNNIDGLLLYIVDQVNKRDYFEYKQTEDEVLIGLLSLGL